VFNNLNIAHLSQLLNDILANGIGIHNSFKLVPTFATGEGRFEPLNVSIFHCLDHDLNANILLSKCIMNWNIL
jgi:hypothetical protein